MTTQKKWPYFVIGGAVALTLAVVAGLALVHPAEAASADGAPSTIVGRLGARLPNALTQDWGPGGPHGGDGPFGNYDEYLAEALGITVEELQAAQKAARAAAIQQAVADGVITQEQADLMSAHDALRGYIDRDALLAEALGITVDELHAAWEEGKSMPDLLDELGLDAAAVNEALRAAYEAAVQQAVTDGVITQEQADLILSGDWPGFHMPGDGMRPGGPGPGHPPAGSDD
jgi:hypothetical protein